MKLKDSPKFKATLKAKKKKPTIPTTEAMRQGGYPEGTVRGGHAQTVRNCINNSLKSAYEKIGLTGHIIAEKTLEGIKATNKEGKTDFNTAEKFVRIATSVLTDENKKETVEVNVNVDKPNLSKLTTEELETYLTLKKKANGSN